MHVPMVELTCKGRAAGANGAEGCYHVGGALRPCALAWLRKRKPPSAQGSFIALPAPLFGTTSLNIQRLPLKCGRGVTGPPTPRSTLRGVVSRTRLLKPRRLLVGRSSSHLWSLSGGRWGGMPLICPTVDCWLPVQPLFERPHPHCHHPRKRVIQYSRDAGDGIERPRRTGYPACAGYDDRVWSCAFPHATSSFKTPCSRHRSQSNRRYGTTTPCSSDTRRRRRSRTARRTAASESAASRCRRISHWP